MNWIAHEIVRPLAHRLGTAIGVALASFGVAAGDIETIVAAVPVVLGVAADLIIRRVL